ncbi:hypothetical protein [Streptomyces aureus]|uniref:hypothetical protein n=1 Tax=Streptomyces aureus TaxID=193461 RepID=UPI00368F5516
MNRTCQIPHTKGPNTLFRQNAGALPADTHATTPDILASYAYDTINAQESLPNGTFETSQDMDIEGIHSVNR